MPRGFRHLDLSERVFIETQLSQGKRPAGIAAELRRARSTITWEIRRNRWRAKLRKGAIAGGYRSVAADRRARVLAGKARRQRKLKPGNQLWISMVKHLRRGLSPVQIASTLARMADPVRLSHEAIYTALYAMPRGQLRASLLDLLRRRHKARRPAPRLSATPLDGISRGIFRASVSIYLIYNCLQADVNPSLSATLE
jgi:IS30 family transposase